MRVLLSILAIARRTFYVVWGGTGLLALIGFLSQARDNKRFYGTLSLAKNGSGIAMIFLMPLSLVRIAAKALERGERGA